MLADIKPGLNSCNAVVAFSYLLNAFNLEFFWKSWLHVHKHLFYLLKLRLSGVWQTRSDSLLFFSANDRHLHEILVRVYLKRS